ncbi:DinB family protein [Streptomyces litchfieldiae]|uniref:DinB family protein n=1 Tax=Streptomyces litchfieldiae TaxID=3075543 RepID=A0ABU2MZJ9_9ACTN|nr:DinB family protein [Streptomyces sp. DSM 44938]MDT0347076.1 DinB family protein [Streptomyces sp. DSM 44938]
MRTEPGRWQDLTLRLFRRIRSDLVAAIDGAPTAELNQRLLPATNSIGWLAWHIGRGQDRNLSEIIGSPQIWLSDGWAARFGRPADPGDTGFGHSPAEAADFRSPSVGLLLAYQAAAQEIAERYLTTAPDGDLSRIVVSPTLGNRHTVEERLSGLLRDCFAHTGQIALLRGC